MLSSAKSHCQEKLGSLVEYTSHYQEELLLSFLREKYDDDFRFWIGLRDSQDEENFVWEQSGQQVNCLAQECLIFKKNCCRQPTDTFSTKEI